MKLFSLPVLFSLLLGGVNAHAANLQTRNNACLDVVDGRFSNGASLQLWGCANGSRNQQWELSGGQLKSNGRCLDVKDGQVRNGGQLQLWECVPGNKNQAWEIAGQALRLRGSNMCLDVRDGQYGNGGQVQLYTCDFRGTGNQVWNFGGGQAQNAPRADTGDTFYGYPAVSLDRFMQVNPMCAWIKDAVAAAARDIGVNATFLATACIVESSCTDPANGWGPFQFSDEGAWRAYGGANKNRRNIWDAAYGAARFFKDLLNEYNGDLDRALRHYNGPIQNGGNPRYQTEYRIWMSGGNAWQQGG